MIYTSNQRNANLTRPSDSEYLGFVLSEGQISMDSKKVAGIADWPAPTTLKQLRS